ncbi:MAG TPA: hypothetical protein VKT82_25775 [Ktedonobacterales bacterium]|nr:hypothetical protein [Ktedonobacterales bacterium]
MASSALSRDAAQPSLQTDVDDQRWYAVCGTRLYSIATLAGGFPDRGEHQPKEMGGVWAPPLKLLDGYWLGLQAQGQAIHWLTAPENWRMAEDGVTLHYVMPALGLSVERREWVVPDEPVLIVDVTISQHPGATWGDVPGLACGMTVRSDLHGAWLAEERLGWTDGEDVATYDDALGALLLHDARQPLWQVCVGADQMPIAWNSGKDVWGPEHTSGQGTGGALWYRCQASQTQPVHLRFLLAGVGSDTTSAASVFAGLARPVGDAARFESAAKEAVRMRSLDEAQREARERFRQPFTRCILQSPDAQFNQVFAWAKTWAAMLMLDVPGVGRAAMAGLPEFPWWFGCDLAYGVLPMLPAGQTEDACASLRTLATLSQQTNKTGAVAHEIVSPGLVAHPGNLVETPLFARALYHTYRWSGDRSLLEELFPFCLRGIEEWTLGACLEPGEYVPRGASIVETPEMSAGLQTLDVAAYLVEALDLFAALAIELGQPEVETRLHTHANKLRKHLREDWWLPEERLFGDIWASRADLAQLQQRLEALPRPDASARSSVELLRQTLVQDRRTGADALRRPWLLYHMVQALAADAGLPEYEQAAELLARLETPEWTETAGIVLNAATNRRVMTLPTGALAVGEARYGRAEQALGVMQRMAAAFGVQMPGTLSEYAPDAHQSGDGGCFLQLWSNYGIVWPVVHYFFGLRPDVATRHLMCVPQLPDAWPSARLSALPLGDAEAEVELVALPNGLRVKVEMTAADWKIALGAALPVGASISEATLNGEAVTLRPTQSVESEGRQTWLAPARHGFTHYELCVSWSRDQQ